MLIDLAGEYPILPSFRGTSSGQLGSLLDTGKCAPRLFADLRDYDPRKKNRNTLVELPPHFIPNGRSTQSKHKHMLILMPEHSSLPPYPSLDTTKNYNVAAMCEECRLHFDIEVDFSKATLESTPCPTAGNYLHHFRYEPLESAPLDLSYLESHRGERWTDKRIFNCSAKYCPIIISITTKSPILTSELTTLLVDKEILKARIKRIQERHSASFDPDVQTNPPTPYQVLDCLASYLGNLLKCDQRHIPRYNKRLISTLGDECDEILQKAHFLPVRKDGAEFWKPPSVEELQSPTSPIRRDIREMLEEVHVLMDRKKVLHEGHNITRADKDIKTLLGCGEYPSASNWHVDLTAPEHPHYAGLGATSDFSDKLIQWAYERQRDCDPIDAPYYFECFSGIAAGRKSEILQMEVAKMRSQGAFTTSDIEESYKALNIESNTTDEDLIIGVFRSRLADAPRQEAQMRENLRIIGKAMNSQKILQIAQRAIADVGSAYAWLGVPDSTDDHFILSTYEVRIKDSPKDEPTAKEALRVIAETRQSPILLSFLEMGSIYDAPMDLKAALSTLGIEDTDDKSLSDDLLINVYTLRLQDAPGQLQDLRTALRAIGEARDSGKIKAFLQTGATDELANGSPNWPVGLENIGNTCYLNSLLQFYFTVKPLREMILNLDEYQEMEVTDEVVERKRVGGRKVSKKEIERAKKFASHLRTLFQNLISSPSSSVTPERDLAYLALVSSKDEDEEVRRLSMASDRPPPLIEITGVDDDKMDIDVKGSATQDVADDVSEATLVNDPPPPYEDDYVMVEPKDDKPRVTDDKENIPLKKQIVIDTADTQRPPLQDIEMNEVQNDTQKLGESEITLQAPLTPPPEVPERPPPIPPRPERKNTTTTDINPMFGRQQDVTECIGNVMFQIEAAIKPMKVDDNGEQVDLVKELFYGKTKQTLSFPSSSETRTKEELFSHLLVDVAEGDRDIYSALDSSFDIEKVDLEGREAKRYLSISHLPPILQIQVQRVQFDRQRGSAYKSNAHLRFPEIIYMDRYMETEDSALKNRREESWKWKKELKALEERKAQLAKTKIGIPVEEALTLTREFLMEIDEVEDDMDFDPNILTALEEEASSVRRELSGSVSFGHYWIYIYDFQAKIFRKYNDGYVTEVKDESEVFTHSDQQPPTPYFLVFVREDLTSDIMEAVKREIP
ncbi:ubiquitin-specific protease ubp2 [Rhizina undulata]